MSSAIVLSTITIEMQTKLSTYRHATFESE